MNLPDWVTCKDCRRATTCEQFKPESKECAFTPSRFYPKSKAAMFRRAQAEAVTAGVQDDGAEVKAVVSVDHAQLIQALAPAAPTVLTRDMMDQLEDLDR